LDEVGKVPLNSYDLLFYLVWGHKNHKHPRIGLDLVQPPAFLAGLIFVQMVFTAAQNMTSMWPQCAAAVLMPVWVMVFQCLGALSAFQLSALLVSL
jgi:hypothetical protein